MGVTTNFNFTTLNGTDAAGHTSINTLITSIDTILNSSTRLLPSGLATTANYTLVWNGSVLTTAQLPTGGILDGAVTEAKIATNAVSAGKLASTLDLTSKTVTVATATTGDNDTSVASTAFVQNSIAALAGAGGVLALLDTATFNTIGSTTYTMPANAKLLYIECIGAGGGGQSGSLGSNNFFAANSTGGQGGPFYSFVVPTNGFSNPVTVHVGEGGAGGATQTAVDSSVNEGARGECSSFGYLKFPGGAASYIYGYILNIFTQSHNNRLGAGSSTLPGYKSVYGGAGGGGGGKDSGTPNGNAGGEAVATDIDSILSPTGAVLNGGGGTAGTAGGNGGNGINPGDGGGGGAYTNTGAAGSGGNGASPGGGGGGGGTGVQPATSGGAGGKGGNAEIRIWVYG